MGKYLSKLKLNKNEADDYVYDNFKLLRINFKAHSYLDGLLVQFLLTLGTGLKCHRLNMLISSVNHAPKHS